jgi:hypothetical protein
VTSCLIAWAGITLMSPYMPTTAQRTHAAEARMTTDNHSKAPVPVPAKETATEEAAATEKETTDSSTH